LYSKIFSKFENWATILKSNKTNNIIDSGASTVKEMMKSI